MNGTYALGKKIDIACQCWFTASGDPTPIMLKYKDENEEIQTVRDIFVMRKEKLFPGCSPTTEFLCKIEFNGIERKVILKFSHSSGRWEMVI